MRTARRISVLSSWILFLAISPASGAETKNLEKTPQAKAYRAQLKAVAAGDFEGYKKSMTSESQKGIDKQIKDSGLDAKKGMELLKAMAPADLKFTSLNVDGKKATLEATGKVGGETNKGTIFLEEEDGQWKIANQSWTNAK